MELFAGYDHIKVECSWVPRFLKIQNRNSGRLYKRGLFWTRIWISTYVVKFCFCFLRSVKLQIRCCSWSTATNFVNFRFDSQISWILDSIPRICWTAGRLRGNIYCVCLCVRAYSNKLRFLVRSQRSSEKFGAYFGVYNTETTAGCGLLDDVIIPSNLHPF